MRSGISSIPAEDSVSVVASSSSSSKSSTTIPARQNLFDHSLIENYPNNEIGCQTGPVPILEDPFGPGPPTPPDLGKLPISDYIPSHFHAGTSIRLADGATKTVGSSITISRALNCFHARKLELVISTFIIISFFAYP